MRCRRHPPVVEDGRSAELLATRRFQRSYKRKLAPVGHHPADNLAARQRRQQAALSARHPGNCCWANQNLFSSFKKIFLGAYCWRRQEQQFERRPVASRRSGAATWWSSNQRRNDWSIRPRLCIFIVLVYSRPRLLLNVFSKAAAGVWRWRCQRARMCLHLHRPHRFPHILLNRKANKKEAINK